MVQFGQRPVRKSHRLQGYDYTQSNGYFVTIVTKDRECLFGEVAESTVELNRLGEIVSEEWVHSRELRPELTLDEFVVMPNHIHAIIVFQGVGAHGGAPLRMPSTGVAFRPPRSLGSFIAGFNSATTKRINLARNTPGLTVWQRNYYDRVIRDGDELDRIRRYIMDTPPTGPAIRKISSHHNDHSAARQR